jgi:hypothetical protein
VPHKGHEYKSLAGHNPHSDTIINEKGKLYPLDPGWQLCPNTPDAHDVCKSYPWATHALVFADGSAHWTKTAPQRRRGAKADDGRLRQERGLYGIHGIWILDVCDGRMIFAHVADVLLRRSLD